MPCFGPLRGWYSKSINPETGKRPIVFNANDRDTSLGPGFDLPCGRCIGCQYDRSRQWALRCMHEKRMWPRAGSAFLTLTYDDKHLPARSTLVREDLQLFMKRLRKQRPPGLRFFACGEYGELTARPHYHVLLFNTCFPDMRQPPFSDPKARPMYVSAELTALWFQGEHLIGDVTNESCAYVAQYCVKKMGKDVLQGRLPEFIAMSNRPGIGASWYEKYKREAYAHDSAIKNGREVSLPRYYDEKFKGSQLPRMGKLENDMDRIKRERFKKSLLLRIDRSQRRMRVREELAQKISQMKVREV